MVTTNPKPILDTHTKKEKNPNITLKIVIKLQGKRAKEEEKNKKNYRISQKTTDKMAISTYISIITLNVNGLNALIKRHRVAEWTQKQNPYICCLQETHFLSKDTQRLNVRL